MKPNEIDELIRIELGGELDGARYEAARARVLANLEMEHVSSRTAPARWWKAPPRVVIASIAVVVLCAGVATASGPVRRIFGDGKSSANHVTALQAPSITDARGDAVAAVDVLKQPRSAMTEEDIRQYLESAPGLGTTGAQYGELLEVDDNLRLLVDTQTAEQSMRIFAAPTSNGSVCYWTQVIPIDAGTTQCTSELGVTTPLTIGRFVAGKRGPQFVYGVLADDVEGVSVMLADGTSQSVDEGRNAFIWADTTGSLAPVGVVLEMADGSTREMDLNGNVRGQASS
ncbi:MAG: hypothetical protein KDC46_14590 [Thermoleophilia bacterium]|nr:hypothetical protein [Thermoleophilia bacterium]